MANKLTIAFVAVIFLFLVALAVLPRFVHPIYTPVPVTCISNLRQIDGAIQAWAVGEEKTTNDIPTWDDIRPYLGHELTNEIPKCPQGGIYTLGRVADFPKCSIGGPSHTLPQ